MRALAVVPSTAPTVNWAPPSNHELAFEKILNSPVVASSLSHQYAIVSAVAFCIGTTFAI
jgi:hypothetical protein